MKWTFMQEKLAKFYKYNIHQSIKPKGASVKG